MRFKKNCLMEIYTRNEYSFSVGFFLSNLNEYSLFKFIDDQGKFDGLYLVNNTYIQDVKYDTEYLNKISNYIEYWNENSCKYNFSTNFDFQNYNNFEKILNYVKENNIISSFVITNDECLITGYIKEIFDKYVVISCIDIETATEIETLNLNKKEILLFEFESIENTLLHYAYKKKQV